MSTPQNILFRLDDKLDKIADSLEYKDEDGVECIFDSIKKIQSDIKIFHDRIHSLEDKMNLIIKLLGKTNV